MKGILQHSLQLKAADSAGWFYDAPIGAHDKEGLGDPKWQEQSADGHF